MFARPCNANYSIRNRKQRRRTPRTSSGAPPPATGPRSPAARQLALTTIGLDRTTAYIANVRVDVPGRTATVQGGALSSLSIGFPIQETVLGALKLFGMPGIQ